MWIKMHCVWQVKLCDLSLTRAISERFRDEYHTHYKAPYANLMFTVVHCLCITYKFFFPIVDTCLRPSCEDIAGKVVRWCADGEFNFLAIFAPCIFSEPRAAHF